MDVRTTAEMVRRNDHEKYGRMRYLYDVDWGDPALYDVVINTEKLSVEAGVELIVGLVRSLAVTEASRQHVRDRALASRVRAALRAHPETRKYRINVEADHGVIQLEGTAALDRAARGGADRDRRGGREGPAPRGAAHPAVRRLSRARPTGP